MHGERKRVQTITIQKRQEKTIDLTMDDTINWEKRRGKLNCMYMK